MQLSLALAQVTVEEKKKLEITASQYQFFFKSVNKETLLRMGYL